MAAIISGLRRPSRSESQPKTGLAKQQIISSEVREAPGRWKGRNGWLDRNAHRPQKSDGTHQLAGMKKSSRVLA